MSGTTGRALGTRRRRTSGQATVETIAMLPLILLMFIMAIEAFAFIMTIEEVNNAARTGARVEGQGKNGAKAAYDALPDRLHKDTTKVRVRGDGVNATATVTARVPLLLADEIDWSITRTVQLPVG